MNKKLKTLSILPFFSFSYHRRVAPSMPHLLISFPDRALHPYSLPSLPPWYEQKCVRASAPQRTPARGQAPWLHRSTKSCRISTSASDLPPASSSSPYGDLPPASSPSLNGDLSSTRGGPLSISPPRLTWCTHDGSSRARRERGG